MLVLGRRVGQRFVVKTNPPIVITMVDVCGRYTARIGIDAPREIEIARDNTMSPEEFETYVKLARGNRTNPAPG